MSAFFVFHGTVKDAEKFAEYAKGVPPTLEPYGGKIFIRGKMGKVLAGEHNHNICAILKFPDQERAYAW